MPYSTEVIRRVYNDEDGVCIQVGPDADGLDCVEVSTPDPASGEYFGKVRFVVTREFAALLGKALVDAAEQGTSG
jgi:hypothetical protein